MGSASLALKETELAFTGRASPNESATLSLSSFACPIS